jgi:hypothetical protein
MKTYLTYGFAMALAGGLITLALYFLGYHTDAAKAAAAQWVGLPFYLAASIIILVLGIKARRSEIPLSEPFGYGRAFGAGVLVILFGALFGIIFNYLYFQFINPGFADLMIQVQSDKMEAKNMGAAQIEQMERVTRMMMKPPIMAIGGFLQSMFVGTIIALITASFLRRPASAESPPLA